MLLTSLICLLLGFFIHLVCGIPVSPVDQDSSLVAAKATPVSAFPHGISSALSKSVVPESLTSIVLTVIVTSPTTAPKSPNALLARDISESASTSNADSVDNEYAPRSRNDIILAASTEFGMSDEALRDSDFISVYKAWEDADSANVGIGNRTSASRYAAIHWGEPDWVCDPDNGCATKPSAKDILEYVEVISSDLTRDERLLKAQQIYFAGMHIWALNRIMGNVNRALDRTKSSTIAKVGQIVLDFTNQEDPKSIFMCELRKQIMGFIFWAATTSVDFALSQLTDVKFDTKGKIIGVWEVGMKIPDNKNILDGKGLTGWTNDARGFAMDWHGLAGTSPATVGPQQKEKGFLYMDTLHTNDPLCLGLDGVAGTGADNLWRVSEMSLAIPGIFDDYLERVTSIHRKLSGLEATEKESQKMSYWMENNEWEDTMQQLDNADPSRVAKSMTHSMTGYFISVALSANKCYLKCDSDMDPFSVLKGCHNPKYSAVRFCPAEEPNTLCQASCYTMIEKYNHEKELIGKDNFGKFGYNLDAVLNASWSQYVKVRNDVGVPELQFTPNHFTLSSGDSSLVLSVSHNKHNKIADKLDRSKDFPCFSGDWTGADTQAFLKRISMGINSTDWGSTNNIQRAWEMFQRRCPWKARHMAPLTQYLNMNCAHGLVWPSKDATLLVKNRKLKPDHKDINGPTCRSLLTKIREQNLDEDTANYKFCTAEFPEYHFIANREMNHIYAGSHIMPSHAIKCKRWLPRLSNATMERVKGSAPFAAVLDNTDVSTELVEGEVDYDFAPYSEIVGSNVTTKSTEELLAEVESIETDLEGKSELADMSDLEDLGGDYGNSLEPMVFGASDDLEGLAGDGDDSPKVFVA